MADEFGRAPQYSRSAGVEAEMRTAEGRRTYLTAAHRDAVSAAAAVRRRYDASEVTAAEVLAAEAEEKRLEEELSAATATSRRLQPLIGGRR